MNLFTQRLLSTALVCTAAFFAACGGGDDDTPTTGGGAAHTLTLSGTDTAQIGTSVTFTEFAFGQLGGVPLMGSLAAGTDTLVMRLESGEDIDTLPATGAFVVTSGSLVSLHFFRNNGASVWLYSLVCLSGAGTTNCPNIVFDRSARTVTFNGTTLRATVGGSSGSLASAPLTLTGTLRWTLADE